MEFISLLICLALEKWTEVGKTLRRYDLFDRYISLVNKLSQRFELKDYLGLAMFLAPLIVLVGVVYLILWHISFGILALVFEIIVLIYCFNAFNFCELKQEIAIEEIQEDQRDMASTFISANRNIFSVMFWFVLLGPVGAVIYRLNHVMTYHAKTTEVSEKALQLQALLEWIPVRLETLSYALVSHFIDVMGVWSKYVLKGLNSNDVMLTMCGSAATRESQASTTDSCKLSVRVIERGLIIWLVIIALTILV